MISAINSAQPSVTKVQSRTVNGLINQNPSFKARIKLSTEFKPTAMDYWGGFRNLGLIVCIAGFALAALAKFGLESINQKIADYAGAAFVSLGMLGTLTFLVSALGLSLARRK